MIFLLNNIGNYSKMTLNGLSNDLLINKKKKLKKNIWDDFFLNNVSIV